jgi:arylsulfatase A-like enzyme
VSESQTFREPSRSGLAVGLWFGALGGALAGAADGVHAALGTRLGVGGLGLTALVLSGAAVGAVIGAAVGGASWAPRAARPHPHLPFVVGAGAAAALRFALSLDPTGRDALAWAGGVAALVVAVGLAALAARRRPYGPRLAVVVVAVVGFAWGVAGRPSAAPLSPSTRERPNVLLVTLGGARPDRLGAWPIDTPAMDRVVAEGVSFQLAWAPSPDTAASAKAVLTGRAPWDEPLSGSLATALVARGWQTGAFVGTDALARDGVLDAGFLVYDDEQGWAKGFSRSLAGMAARAVAGGAPGHERRADEVVDRALRWIGSRSGRWMAWVHLHDPTAPFDPPPPWDERYYHGSDPRSPSRAALGPDAPIHPVNGDRLAGITDPGWVEARYDGEVAWTDSQIARLVEGIESDGLAPTTLVVIVGLHGEVLRDGPTWYGRDGALVDAALHVPFAVRLPARLPAGDRYGGPVELIDLAPTLLEWVGESDALPSSTGLSLVPALDGTGRPRAVARAAGPGATRAAAIRAPGLVYRRDPVTGDEVVRTADGGPEVWTPDGLAALAAAAAALDGTGRPPPDAALLQELSDSLLPVLPDPAR